MCYLHFSAMHPSLSWYRNVISDRARRRSANTTAKRVITYVLAAVNSHFLISPNKQTNMHFLPCSINHKTINLSRYPKNVVNPKVKASSLTDTGDSLPAKK